MPARTTPTSWLVVSLRPSGEHDALRRAAAHRNARLLALSPWRLRANDDGATRSQLRAALSAQRLVFTSPMAVRAAHALVPLRARRGQQWCAVGTGTAAALQRAGITKVHVPARMDSEGLLALPALQVAPGDSVGLVTAPGGRDALAPALRARGASIVRADVYVREAIAPSSRALATLRTTHSRLLLPLSSGEALQRTLVAVPDDIASQLRRARVSAASARLATLARELGFTDIVLAAGPRPRDLLAAAWP